MSALARHGEQECKQQEYQPGQQPSEVVYYRHQLFPRRVYARTFDALLAGLGETSLPRYGRALAHERVCEAELASALQSALDERVLPDLKSLIERFRPRDLGLPVVVDSLPVLAIYDEIAATTGEAE
jgi:hypothetical protein